MDIEVRGETFKLLPERALFWPKHQTLMISDLHLGKAEVFQRSGLLLPSQANTDDLDLLKSVAVRENAKQIYILGDLVHSHSIVSGEIEQQFAAWNKELNSGTSCKVTVILGNHDRGLSKKWPKLWEDIKYTDSIEKEGFLFIHEPLKEETDLFCWMGHIHPMVVLDSGSDRMRLPCFSIDKHTGTLPAFSRLAGGFTIKPEKGRKLYALASDHIFPL